MIYAKITSVVDLVAIDDISFQIYNSFTRQLCDGHEAAFICVARKSHVRYNRVGK